MLNREVHRDGVVIAHGRMACAPDTVKTRRGIAVAGDAEVRDELHRNGEWLTPQGQQDRLEGPDPAPSRCFDHRAHLGMEPGAPDRAEAVGDLAEDRTPAQRLLRAIVGWGSLGLEEEDE